MKGRSGWKQTEEQKRNLSEKLKAHHAKKPKVTPEQRRRRVLVNVQAYYARKRNAILPTSDLKLIKKIYEHCPKDYHEDHIHSLSTGGPHHQDNLQYLPGPENCRKNASNPYDVSLIIRWQDTIPQ